MLNTTIHFTSEARSRAADTTAKHLWLHGAGLCDLLEAIDDPRGLSAICNLHGAFGQPFPDTDTVEDALRDIHSVLAEEAPSSLDSIGYERKLPVSDMTRWHGARVSELLALFQCGE